MFIIRKLHKHLLLEHAKLNKFGGYIIDSEFYRIHDFY